MLAKIGASLVALSLMFPVFSGQPLDLQPGGPTTESHLQATDNLVQDTDTPNPDVQTLLEEMTFVWLLSEEYARVETVCAGNGLNNIEPLAEGSKVLIPNAGDLAVNGSNVAAKLHPDGEITFIPRTQGQRIRVPVEVGDNVAGQEVLSLSLAEGLELMTEGHLVWTAKHQGPYGNGHGLPGHIAECDPLYPGPAEDDGAESEAYQ